MSFLNKECLVSEPVIPSAGSFNSAAMAQGLPGVPMAFSWRDTEYRVKRILGTRKNLRPCRNGSSEKYVNKQYFRVETEAGEIMTLYRSRSGSRKDSWTLYTIEDASTEVSPMKIAVLVSGGGTNLQALIDAQAESGKHSNDDASGARSATDAGRYEIVLVIADRTDAYAVERAKKHGIPAELALPPAGVPRAEARLAVSDRVLALAREYRADALVLAGFLTIMGGDVITEYSGRIINLHPALLPKFGGKGMWGHHVHEAVLAAGESESGCTVHLVDSGCDTGPILLQRKVPVLPLDTPDTLAERIHGEEHRAIVEGVTLLSQRLAK
jgi:phosphoribosylglycinamide formyltransferase-1